MNQSEPIIDIILPVYNAFDELQNCIKSIQQWTPPEKYRLIIINDNSTDARVAPFLERIKQEHTLLIHNSHNLGFSRNVNLGIAQSDTNDVLLLNSDTIVTRRWLEKLTACAYKNRMTATVTPLSNNATLCSVPEFCQQNPIPAGYSLDAYAQLIEETSLRLYPVIPVANGFCMYIKREAIRQVGVFDAQAFEKGYGEENDFCFRAALMGWQHVMCDDTYIFHSGTSSFENREKRKQMERHEKILEERYPAQMQEVRVHCRDHPTAAVTENIRLRTVLKERVKRPVILYLLQADFRDDADDHTGGTQLHVKDLVDGLRGKYDIVVAARNRGCLNVTLYMAKEELVFQYEMPYDTALLGRGATRKIHVSSEGMAKLYRQVLEAFSPEIVHIHHTKDMTLELFWEAKRASVPVFVTVHDYYFLCPNEKLLDHNGQSCSAYTGEPGKHCRDCLKKQYGIAETVPYLSVWRAQHQKALMGTQRIFVPSESARNIVTGCYSGLQDKIRVIGHGTGTGRADTIGSHTVRKRRGAFHIAFVGGISTAKGYRQAASMIRKSGRDIHWYLFGSFERREYFLEKRGNFTNVGVYQREELPGLFAKYAIDLVCVLSVWQETFCYTVSEAVLSGIPVLVTDAGALGERVRRMGCGWVVPVHEKPEQILAWIGKIRRSPSDYAQKQKNARRAKIPTAEEMCRMYDAQYQSCMDQNKESKAARQITCDDFEKERWLLEGALAAKKIAGGMPGGAVTSIRLREAQSRLSEIENSFTYRLMMKIAKLPVPCKSSIRAALLTVYRWLAARR